MKIAGRAEDLAKARRPHEERGDVLEDERFALALARLRSEASRRDLLKGFAGAAAAGLLTVADVDETEANSPVGTLLVPGSTWGGTNVHSNGNSYGNASRGQYGLEYQCVELVQRFYARRGYPTTWNVDAFQMYKKELPDLVAIPNGGKRRPAWGDIIVFDQEPNRRWDVGHVAIVYAEINGRVYFVEQNVRSQANQNATGKGSLPLDWISPNNTWRIRTHKSIYPAVLGWRHTSRLAVVWQSPVGNEREFFPGSRSTVTLTAQTRGDRRTREVEFWHWDAVNSHWTFLGQDARAPYQVILRVSNLNYGWNQINAEAEDGLGEVSYQYIWIFRDHGDGPASAASAQSEVPPAPQTPPRRRRER